MKPLQICKDSASHFSEVKLSMPLDNHRVIRLCANTILASYTLTSQWFIYTGKALWIRLWSIFFCVTSAISASHHKLQIVEELQSFPRDLISIKVLGS